MDFFTQHAVKTYSLG